MIYVLLGISLLFIAIGFAVTESNARYLLAGYNTLNEAERQQVDINRAVDLVDQLPAIILRTNGFALGTVWKGYFKTSEVKTVKLILNSDQKPLIRIVKIDGKQIYFSAKEPVERSDLQQYQRGTAGSCAAVTLSGYQTSCPKLFHPIVYA
ncbi:hypothetical protein GCM10023187_33850 [Nibrella viscosa]|uniref:Uncharacterized protein n=1 Tax=Nibrella viscosa TaxID=1084524 RepID=A0ABP8KM54_9BACT